MRPAEHDQGEIVYIGLVVGHGGDATQMLELASGMAARGRRVRIVVPELDTTVGFADLCRDHGVAVTRTPLLRADATGVRQDPLAVLRVMRSTRGSLVHLHTGNDCVPRTFLGVMRALRTPKAFVTLHGPWESLRPGDPRSRVWVASVPRLFHKVVCPSQHAVRSQIGYGVRADLVECINNGLDLRRFGNGRGERIHAELGIDRTAPLVVFTSRLEQQKRPLEAIRAFALVADEFPRAHLAVVGTGTLGDEARRLVDALDLRWRIHVLGHRRDVADWLAAATVWVLPTESENFSVSVLEALGSGCPVLSTLCPGNDEVLVDGENSIIHEVGDVTGQVNGLRQLLSSPALRARLSAAARETASNFTVDRMVDSYARCYRAAGLAS